MTNRQLRPQLLHRLELDGQVLEPNGRCSGTHRHTVHVSFGQQSGPPASSKQIAFILSLLQQQGFDFATARHQFGLTQRQSRGKFTVKEASELIERLQDGDEGGETTIVETPVAREAREKLDTKRSTLIRGIPAEQLADELERRGWVVIPPN